MTDPLDNFRRDAKALQKSYDAMAPEARARVEVHVKPDKPLKRADFLHIIAREQTYISWPAMKDAVDRFGLDRAGRQQRLKIALHNGNMQGVRSLVWDDAKLTEGAFALKCALFERDGVEAWLKDDPAVVQTVFGPRGKPLNHLAFSRVLQIFPEREADMLAIAQMLVDAGADVNEAHVPEAEPHHIQTPLYGAIGSANNMVLGQWLLDQGANPTDGEALYHASEIGHAEGLRMLCKAGANPNGTNALKRAMDFDDPEMVQLLLDAGADPNEGHNGWTTLHHAALRMCAPAVCRLLIEAGADPAIIGNGISAYAAARVYGNAALADMMTPVPLSAEEKLLAQAVTGDVPDGVFIDPNKVPDLYLDLVREFAAAPEKLDHIKALIKLGMPWDRPDGSGVPPVQMAGFAGQVDMLAYFLQLKPDLGHRNAYGGGILGTILHGSLNNSKREGRDYITCLELVLKEGVALPESAIRFAGDADTKAFLEDWAKRFPQQVIKHGYA